MTDNATRKARFPSMPAWIARPFMTPLTAAVIAFLLVVAGLLFAVQLDRIGRDEKVQQINVQAQILASGIAAPLAFDDTGALREYLDALRANPQIIAAGAYAANGRFVAGYAKAPAKLPERGSVEAPILSARDLIVTVPVVEGGTRLGSVYLHTTLDSWPRRAARYFGISAIVIMASALIALLGASYATLRRAHIRLQEEIDSRQKAEDALRQAQKMEALGQLTGGVAHDFNNLLMVALGSLELMERTTDPAKLQRLRGGIRQAVDSGAKLTQQLLTFSRRSPLRAEVVDLGNRVQGMDALLDRLSSDRVTVETHLPPDLWPVEVDPSELEVALLNVALNARDAMTEGGAITISGENLPMGLESGDAVRLIIADSGIGIAPDLIGKIFEPFYTTKGVGHGTGLGLSQVYGFARASGGEVRVESELGKGTRISLLLPRSLKALPKAVVQPHIVTASGNRRILLVEDDDGVAEMVGGMLGEIGYDYERVDGGEAAWERLERGVDFALILSDMIMPGKLSGLDLVRHVGRRWPQLPTMLMTGYSEAATAAMSEGISLIRKPFSMQALSTQIDAALEKA
jgi:signal transduction histidine kinase